MCLSYCILDTTFNFCNYLYLIKIIEDPDMSYDSIFKICDMIRLLQLVGNGNSNAMIQIYICVSTEQT